MPERKVHSWDDVTSFLKEYIKYAKPCDYYLYYKEGREDLKILFESRAVNIYIDKENLFMTILSSNI